jgi:hypothetical protein
MDYKLNKYYKYYKLYLEKIKKIDIKNKICDCTIPDRYVIIYYENNNIYTTKLCDSFLYGIFIIIKKDIPKELCYLKDYILKIKKDNYLNNYLEYLKNSGYDSIDKCLIIECYNT